MSVKEISSLLVSRSTLHPSRTDDIPHHHWDLDTRAALVILWGLLVYPILDPDLRKNKEMGWIDVHQLTHLFKEYLGDQKECVEILFLFKHFDYIRLQSDGRITAGTELLSAVDAAKMYRLFRASVLARKLFQKKNIPEIQQNPTIF